MKDFSLYPLLLPQLASDAFQIVPFCSGESVLQGHTLLATATPSPPQQYTEKNLKSVPGETLKTKRFKFRGTGGKTPPATFILCATRLPIDRGKLLFIETEVLFLTVCDGWRYVCGRKSMTKSVRRGRQREGDSLSGIGPLDAVDLTGTLVD